MKIEQVKEYFKDALIVQDSYGYIVDLSKVNLDTMWKSDSGTIYIINHNGIVVRLYSSEFQTYSEILESNIPKEWSSDELEFYHTGSEKWVTLGNGTSRIRFKTDNSEKTIALENQKPELERQIAELKC